MNDVKNGTSSMNMNHLLDIRYETLCDDSTEGYIACGFLPKKPEERHHHFSYYGGFLILSGSGFYVDEHEKKIPVGKGDFVQRRPGIGHVTIVEDSEPWLEFYVCFGPSLYKALVHMKVISDEPVLHPGLDQTLTGMCEMLLYKFKLPKPIDNRRLLMDIQIFMLTVNQYSEAHGISDSNKLVVEQVCDLLGRNYNSKVNYEELALVFRIGYEHLRKLFKAQTGYSLNQYRIMKRINEAKRLLHDSELGMKEIASKLGYSDRYAFSKQFRQHAGISPTQFRRQVGGMNLH